MVEEVKKTDSNTKTQLSLAAALFFSPLVQNMLKRNTRDITDQEREFIRWYIKLGYITLGFGIITVAAGILHYIFALNILNTIYTISIFILLSLLIISVVSILSDISLLRWQNSPLHTYTVEGNKKDIILKYLPLYNIYLWYQAHSFDKPNRWIKESIILRGIFVLICSMGSVRWATITLIVIIVRVASLMSDIDMLQTQTKQQLNKIFSKNPEEVRGYVTGFVSYLGKSIKHLFKPTETYTLEQEIAQEKEAYGAIIDITTMTSISIEYILWILILGGIIYLIHPDFTVRTYYVWFWLLLIRYILMAIQLKHLPHFPIARELLLLVKGIGWIFKKQNSFTPSK